MPHDALPLLDAPAARWPRASPQEQAQWPVVLVTMPFMDISRPSIQIGLLAAILRNQGFGVRTLHANLDFAARLGPQRYRSLGERRTRMVGDWLFSVAAFGAAAPDPDGRLLDDFAADLAYLDEAGITRDLLLRTRDEDVPAYLDALVETYDWDRARVVGFSSTFQQNTASIALARRLKQRFPEIVTVFGGANFDGAMGPQWVRCVDCIDMVVVGEGDEALPRLLHVLATGGDPAAVPGIACRAGGEVVTTTPEAGRTRLDESPHPDYDEFFARAAGLGLLPPGGSARIRLPFESARGCWWGAKHHCTFCGLNGTTMAFRAKSPARVVDELVAQTHRYRSFRFEAVDNIVDMAYLRELFPALIERETGFQLFYEVKANLNRDQIRTLAHAGVTAVQPGIESLSSRVLALMNKGARASQNINLLRWARYYGIDVAWNIIWGFPGETEQDYAEQAALLPHLVHLQAPVSAGRLWLERFSPLYQASPGKVPERSYRYIYPADVEPATVAYFFEYDLPGALPDATYEPVSDAVAGWKAASDDGYQPVLRYAAAPGFVQIYDGRHRDAEGTYTFDGPVADLYVACSDRPLSAKAAHERLGGRLPITTIEQAFTEYARRGLMVLDGNLALTLALPSGIPR